MAKTAKLQLGDKSIDLPILEGSEGEKAIDISRLRAQTGYIALDPGFGNTGSCTSSITFIDGDKGILRHRGYRIEDLCEHASFLEVSYLLMNGVLPTEPELTAFKSDIRYHSLIHEDMKNFFNSAWIGMKIHMLSANQRMYMSDSCHISS